MSLNLNDYRKKNKLKTLDNDKLSIETYFDICEDEKEATLNLKYDKPCDIFDTHFASKKPILADDFLNEIYYALKVLPSKYSVNLNIEFNDLENYSIEDLDDIFISSIMMTNEEWIITDKKDTHLGYFFLGLGIFFLVMMFLLISVVEHKVNNADNKLWFRVIKYVLDILAMVMIWESITLFFVKRNESRAKQISFNRRIKKVNFNNKN